MISGESRYPTWNTNLAACLGALRIPIKPVDPVIVTEDAEPPHKRTVTYFFEMESVQTGDLPIEESAKVGWAWNNRERFERENPTHPLIPMRAALDKLGWLTKVWHGNVTPQHRTNKPQFGTKDIDLAACIMATGQELLSFEKPMFNFADHPKSVIEQYDDFRSGTEPVSYMRRALECRRELISLVKQAPTLLHYVHGTPGEGGREGYIAKGSPEVELNRFFGALYD